MEVVEEAGWLSGVVLVRLLRARLGKRDASAAIKRKEESLYSSSDSFLFVCLPNLR